MRHLGNDVHASALPKTARRVVAGLGVVLTLAYAAHALAAAEDQALAKASQNPVASLISVPFENNFNGEWGPNNSNQNVLNVKPVIPVQIGDKLNLINRAIVPFVSQPGIPGGWYLTTAPVVTANWEADNDDKWTVPLGGGMGRVFRIGKQPVNMKMAYYYNAAKPRFGAQWILQLSLMLLFPK